MIYGQTHRSMEQNRDIVLKGLTCWNIHEPPTSDFQSLLMPDLFPTELLLVPSDRIGQEEHGLRSLVSYVEISCRPPANHMPLYRLFNLTVLSLLPFWNRIVSSNLEYYWRSSWSIYTKHPGLCLAYGRCSTNVLFMILCILALIWLQVTNPF